MKTASSRKQNEDPVIKKTIGDSMGQIIQYLWNELHSSVELGEAEVLMTESRWKETWADWSNQSLRQPTAAYGAYFNLNSNEKEIS